MTKKKSSAYSNDWDAWKINWRKISFQLSKLMNNTSIVYFLSSAWIAYAIYWYNITCYHFDIWFVNLIFSLIEWVSRKSRVKVVFILYWLHSTPASFVFSIDSMLKVLTRYFNKMDFMWQYLLLFEATRSVHWGQRGWIFKK